MTIISFTEPDIYDLTCPVCNSRGAKSLLHVETKDLVAGNVDVSNLALSCNYCESVFWKKKVQIGYLSDSDELNELALTHYCAIGAGIDLGVLTLSRIIFDDDNANLLEVGCGFGYNIHFWGGYLGRPALGLEQAAYGASGKSILGVEIKSEYLTADGTPYGEFDVIYSSEVIEHVSDPRAFLAALSRNLSLKGILVLTTPAAEYLTPDGNLSLSLAVLSPGHHQFIITKSAFHKLLLEFDFSDVIVERHNERLIAFAVRQGKVADRIRETTPRSAYLDYLKFLSSNSEGITKQGALYRLFKEQINAALWDHAAITLEDIAHELTASYRLDINILFARNEVQASALQFSDFLYKLPPFIGPLIYYMGILKSHKSEDLHVKLSLFSLSVLLIRNTIQVAPQFAQECESLLDTALLHYRMALVDVLSSQHSIAIGKSCEIDGTFAKEDSVDRYKSHLDRSAISINNDKVPSNFVKDFWTLIQKHFVTRFNG